MAAFYVEKGSLPDGHAAAKQRVTSEFYNHYVAHAPSEPYAVLAHVEDEQVTVWASTQAPFRVRGTVAETLEIPEENVHVITPFVGGGFGGKKSGQQISEAVKLSKITGRPVQLAWTRREEFFYDAFRPAAVVQLESGINAEGHITFWECDILFTGSRSSEPIYNIPHFRVKTRSKREVCIHSERVPGEALEATQTFLQWNRIPIFLRRQQEWIRCYFA